MGSRAVHNLTNGRRAFRRSCPWRFHRVYRRDPQHTTYVSLAEAARRLGCTTRTVRRRIADGSLTGYRMGPRLIRLDAAEVDALLRRIPAGGYAVPMADGGRHSDHMSRCATLGHGRVVRATCGCPLTIW